MIWVISEQCVSEQLVDVPVPQIRREIMDVTQFIPEQELLAGIVEQIVARWSNWACPCLPGGTVEVNQFILERSMSEPHSDVPVLRLMEMVQSPSEQTMDGAHVECFICFRGACGIHEQREFLRTLRASSLQSCASLRA